MAAITQDWSVSLLIKLRAKAKALFDKTSAARKQKNTQSKTIMEYRKNFLDSQVLALVSPCTPDLEIRRKKGKHLYELNIIMN